MGYIRDCYVYDEDEQGERENQYVKEKDCCVYAKHPQPKKILLECGCNPQDAFFEIYYGHVRRHQKFVLDRAIVDTTCLCRPIVKVEFSSIIFFKAEAEYGGGGGRTPEAEIGNEELKAEIGEGAEAQLQSGHKKFEIDLLFELVRVCKGGEETVQSWRYLKKYEIEGNDELEVESSEPFTVTFCDRACSDCCEYKMVVRGRDFEGDIDALRVVKPDLSVLAQGLCEC